VSTIYAKCIVLYTRAFMIGYLYLCLWETDMYVSDIFRKVTALMPCA
jgi:hypothetical protein